VAELTLAVLRRDGEAFMEALTRELYLAGAGHKPNADLQATYKRFAGVLGPAALELTRDAFRSAAPNSEEWRSARALLDWQVEAYASRELAALDERVIAWEASAVIRLPDGGEVPYQRAAVNLSSETNREKRLALDEARAALVGRELAPMRLERLQRERDLIESLEVASSYVPRRKRCRASISARWRRNASGSFERRTRCGRTFTAKPLGGSWRSRLAKPLARTRSRSCGLRGSIRTSRRRRWSRR
jgi:hypothetical protein